VISLQITFDGDDMDNAPNAVQLCIPLFQLYPLIYGCIPERQDLSFRIHLSKNLIPSPATDYTIFHHIEEADSQT
jgi:hypothetical protein